MCDSQGDGKIVTTKQALVILWFLLLVLKLSSKPCCVIQTEKHILKRDLETGVDFIGCVFGNGKLPMSWKEESYEIDSVIKEVPWYLVRSYFTLLFIYHSEASVVLIFHILVMLIAEGLQLHIYI